MKRDIYEKMKIMKREGVKPNYAYIARDGIVMIELFKLTYYSLSS